MVCINHLGWKKILKEVNILNCKKVKLGNEALHFKIKQVKFWSQKLSYPKNHFNSSKSMETNFPKTKRSVMKEWVCELQPNCREGELLKISFTHPTDILAFFRILGYNQICLYVKCCWNYSDYEYFIANIMCVFLSPENSIKPACVYMHSGKTNTYISFWLMT